MIAEHRTERYDPTLERSWHLSVLLSPDLQAWCVHDRSDGSVVALFADKGEVLPRDTQLPMRPMSVSFVALPVISTLVPENALVPGSEMAHLRMVHGHLPTGLLRDEPINALGARCVYLHDEQAEHKLMSRFPNARPLPLQAVLVQAALSRSHAPARAAVVLHRAQKRLDLVIAKDGRLLLSNTFHAVNGEDLLYYTLFAVEQCGLRPADVDLLRSGTHLQESEVELLRRYFPHTAPLAPPTLHSGAPLLEMSHLWAALTEQFACVS
ncbi:MAG TPA: DUF3822 family protein [Flavobacteriales bacterium]